MIQSVSTIAIETASVNICSSRMTLNTHSYSLPTSVSKKYLPVSSTKGSIQTHYIYYVHTYIHTYTHTYIHTHIHTYLHTYIHTYIVIHVHVHAYMYIHSLFHYLLLDGTNCFGFRY